LTEKIIAPGDRVRYDSGGEFVRVGSEWWPGRSGFVLDMTAGKAEVMWEDDGSRSVVPVNRLRLAAPERHCKMCHRDVYLGYGCSTGLLMEWVPDRRGEVTLIAGRGVSLEFADADRQARKRRMLRASEGINRLTAHWRVCPGSPMYVDVRSHRETRLRRGRGAAFDDPARAAVERS
jgi:hypothetical protein